MRYTRLGHGLKFEGLRYSLPFQLDEEGEHALVLHAAAGHAQVGMSTDLFLGRAVSLCPSSRPSGQAVALEAQLQRVCEELKRGQQKPYAATKCLIPPGKRDLKHATEPPHRSQHVLRGAWHGMLQMMAADHYPAPALSAPTCPDPPQA